MARILMENSQGLRAYPSSPLRFDDLHKFALANTNWKILEIEDIRTNALEVIHLSESPSNRVDLAIQRLDNGNAGFVTFLTDTPNIINAYCAKFGFELIYEDPIDEGRNAAYLAAQQINAF